MELLAVLVDGLRERLLSFYCGCNSAQVKVRDSTCVFMGGLGMFPEGLH